MADNLSDRIISLLSKETDELLSISDISKRLGVAYSHAHGFVSDLLREGILESKRVGRTIICRLDRRNPLTIAALTRVSYA